MNKAIQLPNQAKSINLDIDGMTCAACAARIERILSKDNNILDSSVSFPLKLATIDILEDSNFQIEYVIESINKIGYKAREAQEEKEDKKIKFNLLVPIISILLLLIIFLRCFEIERATLVLFFGKLILNSAY